MKSRGAFLCTLPILLALAFPAAPTSASPAAVPAATLSGAGPLQAAPTPVCVAEACDGENEVSASVAQPRLPRDTPVDVRAVRWLGSNAPASSRSPASFLSGRRNE